MTFTLTLAGLSVLYKAMNGERLHFTHAEIGNGEPQPLDQITDLANPLLAIQFDSITVNSNNATLCATFNNASVESGFRMTEAGIFCEDPNNSARKILFAYATEPIESANWIASSSNEIQETQISFVVFVGNAENISAQINESLVYATQAELNEHTNNRRNPHAVTKSQVGLDKVPNVSTNDQTPTFDVPLKIDNIKSGEKLGTMFGKVARAIIDFISHIGSNSNPHNVTASQVGAAKSSHNHSASDINSGTLSVKRGGTGISNLKKGLLLFANDTNMFGQIPAPSVENSVLQQSPSGIPFFAPMTASQFGASEKNHTHSQIGTYTGYGKSGESNKNSLNFSKTPSILFIAQKGHARFAILFPCSNYGISFGSDMSTLNLTVSHTSEIVSWFFPGDENHPANQMNQNDATYDYVAVS